MDEESLSAEEKKFFRKLFSSQTSKDERDFQLRKYRQLVDLLVNAGYFRARIAALSPFDKLIGGLCWSITASGVGVDADILFEENMKLGRKIQLSETVVEVLRKMRCPATLQANQIQGCDFNALQPVLEWLVAKVMETREAREFVNRLFSEQRFDADYSLLDPARTHSESTMARLHDRFRPRRKYQRSQQMWQTSLDEAGRVQSCLLEYGDKVVTAGDGDDHSAGCSASASSSAGGGSLSAFEKKFAAAQKEAEKDAAAQAEREAARERKLMKHMADITGDRGNVAGSSVGRIVGLQRDEIKQASEQYAAESEATRKAAEGREPITRQGRMAVFLRRKGALEKQVEGEEGKLSSAQEEADSLRARADKLRRTRDKASAYIARLKEEVAALEKLEQDSEHADEISKLRRFVFLNEELKSQEERFKASCKAHLAELQAALAQAEAGSTLSGEESERLQEVEDMWQEVKAKHERGKQLLARRIREAATLRRKIDDVPTRTELIQYERRFVELYEQVAAKLGETRKYYATYNTLEQTLSFLQREVSLLQSVSDQYDAAVSSRGGREALLGQLKKINEGLTSSLSQQQGTEAERQSALQASQTEHQSLTDQERKYFKAVKDFQEECDINEQLSKQLAPSSTSA